MRRLSRTWSDYEKMVHMGQNEKTCQSKTNTLLQAHALRASRVFSTQSKSKTLNQSIACDKMDGSTADHLSGQDPMVISIQCADCLKYRRCVEQLRSILTRVQGFVLPVSEIAPRGLP